MAREAICTGKTVEDALEKAYAQLGATSDQSEFEILERPKRSFFGLKVTPAKVRVTLDEPSPPVSKPQPPQQRPAQAAARPTQQQPQPRPVPKEQPAVAAKPASVVSSAPAARPVPTEHFEPKEMTDEGRVKMACASAYLHEIFRDMGLEGIEISEAENGAGAIFTLSGEGLGVLIGRRGETLDALQYISGLVANRLEGDYFRVTIDSGNYRAKREKTLSQLARKLSGQVAKTGRRMTLEPMNPYERRIIHATVQELEGVTSSSIGEEPNRRVVISSTNPRRRLPPKPRDGEQVAAPRTDAPRAATPIAGVPRTDAPRAAAPRTAAPRTDAPRRPSGSGFGNRNSRPPQRGNGPDNVTTRPNAFGQNNATAARIDDSAYQIEPPTPKVVQPVAPMPKAPAAKEEPSKPLYSKIDIDD